MKTKKVVPIKTDRFVKLLVVLITSIFAFVAVFYLRGSMLILSEEGRMLISLIGGLIYVGFASLIMGMSSKHE